MKKYVAKIMKIFEGYKKAVEIYNKNSGTNDGKKIVTWYNNTLGVSKEYLTWFTSCVVCYKIPLYIVLNAYRDWKRYVIPYYKENNMPIPKIDGLQYQQVIKIINQCKRSWSKPNPIYNKDGVYVGEFKSFRDANMLPINTSWCITKTHKRYDEFNNANSKCLYVINNNNQDPYRRVIAVVYTDRVEYWDSTNQRIENNANYENTLPKEVVNIIYNTTLSTNNKKLNCNRNMNKKLIRLTESDLHRIVRESVNKVLNEIGDTNRGQYHLGRAAMRRFNMGDYDKAGEIGRYAEKKRVNDPDYDLESSNSTGMRHQNIYMNGGDPQKYYRDVIQRTDDRLR